MLVHHRSGIHREQGLWINTRTRDDEDKRYRYATLHACLGATGNPRTAFLQSQLQCTRETVAAIMHVASVNERPLNHPEVQRQLRQAGQHTVIDDMQAALADEWPKGRGDLFIATPRIGLEQELVELLLLEELTADAEAGDETAAALLSHLVEECGAASVSELIDAQRSRVQQMIDDQQEQLRIHAEAVQRTEQRSLQLKAANAPLLAPQSADACSVAAVSASSSASVITADIGTLIPATAALSLSSTADKCSSDGLSSATALSHPSAAQLTCSWTADPRLATLDSLRSPGRVKFGTILKATKRFLAALSPQRVSRSGSHCVFHFADRGPVTLVLKHSGGSKDSSVSRHYRTQLYETLHRAVLAPFGMRQQEAQARLQGSKPAAALLGGRAQPALKR